jgi:hypothetical protein
MGFAKIELLRYPQSYPCSAQATLECTKRMRQYDVRIEPVNGLLEESMNKALCIRETKCKQKLGPSSFLWAHNPCGDLPDGLGHAELNYGLHNMAASNLLATQSSFTGKADRAAIRQADIGRNCWA